MWEPSTGAHELAQAWRCLRSKENDCDSVGNVPVPPSQRTTSSAETLVPTRARRRSSFPAKEKTSALASSDTSAFGGITAHVTSPGTSSQSALAGTAAPLGGERKLCFRPGWLGKAQTASERRRFGVAQRCAYHVRESRRYSAR